MNTRGKIIVGVIIAGLLAIALVTFLNLKKADKFGGATDYAAISSFNTSTAVNVTTSNSLIQATTSRQYCIISNNSAFSVYLALTGDAAATANSGILLSASTTFEISQEKNNLYAGAIRGIATGGTAQVLLSCY
jgi:hypothetical protein